MKEKGYINEAVIREVLNEVVYTKEKETKNISARPLIASLKGWLKTGRASEKDYTSEPLKERCDDLRPYHYTYLPTYVGTPLNKKYCRNVNSSHNPLYTSQDAWKVEERIIEKPYFILELEMLEDYFKAKNMTFDDIEDVGVSRRIIKRWDDKNAELRATADILTKDALYMTYYIDEKIKINTEWAYIYINIINMIFKKEKLYMLFIGINGVCESVEFPRGREEELNNFFWNALVPIERKERRFYFNNLRNAEKIEELNLYYHFDVKEYIQKIMGPIDSFLGISIDIWVKALIGDDGIITLSPSLSLMKKMWRIQMCMTSFLKSIDYMFESGNIFYAEILIYKLAATGGLFKMGGIPDSISLMRYLSKDEKPIIKLRHTIARYTERTGKTAYYGNVYNKKMDIKKDIQALHIEATKKQVGTIERFLIQNGITQVIKDDDDVFKKLFISAKYKNKNSLPMFKEANFFGITKSDLFLNCIINKVESALFLGVKQQLEVKVELIVQDEKDEGKQYIFTEVFHWSLKNWWDYDDEEKNNNAAFTSFLNSIVFFRIKNNESLLSIMREYKDEGLKGLVGGTVRVGVYPNPYINDTHHNATEDNAYEYRRHFSQSNFNYAISKNEGSYIVASSKIGR